MGFFSGRDVGLGTSASIAAMFGLLSVWFITTGTTWPGVALGIVGVIWIAIALVRRSR